jgi:hypothetical protein
MKRIYFYRSAVTGRFVSASFAKANPDTTYRSYFKARPA